jgi:hypothetical protein
MCPKLPLHIARNDDPIAPYGKNLHLHNNSSNVVHTYQLYGSETLRKTQNNNLIQKLEEVQKNYEQDHTAI